MNSDPQGMNSSVETFFEDEVNEFKKQLTTIESEYLSKGTIVEQQCLAAFTEAFHISRAECAKVEETLKDEPQRLAAVQQRFRDELAPWFNQSWFFERAKTKPRGYPGDFVMLTALYDEDVKSEGIGRILDLYFLQADLARAVRTRLADVKQFVIEEVRKREDQVAILNVASGPGREYCGEFKEISGQVTLNCIDSDESALEHLQNNIDPKVAEKIELKCLVYNALKTKSAKLNLQNFGLLDIIYSVGLCDYIPDHIMIKILEGWRESVAPGGVVYVAFKDQYKYVASEYQWHADWHFYQRTEEDCLRLFAESGYDMEALEVFRDQTGIIMNFVSRAPVAAGIRSESSQSISGPHFKSKSGRSNKSVATENETE